MTDQGTDHHELDHVDKPIPLRCRLGWHKWGGWSKPYTHQQSAFCDAFGTTPVFEWQKRTCLRCRYIEERMV